MKELLEIIAKHLVTNISAVTVTEAESEDGNEIKLTLSVAEEDMGKVIGKQGRIAKAIRTVIKSAANHNTKRITIEIVNK